MSYLTRLARAAIRRTGFEVARIPPPPPVAEVSPPARRAACMAAVRAAAARRIHYGCGGTYFDAGWMNVDVAPESAGPPSGYLQVDLTGAHPFDDDTFEYGYAEDFLEHLGQADSLVFLAEARRTLAPGGVLRLSFPGLRGVLAKHYPDGAYATVDLGRLEAYTMWGHLHFYCEESIELVARQLGWREVAFPAFGESAHPALHGLETRLGQRDLNLQVELRK